MGAGDRNARTVFAHEGSQGLRAGNDRDVTFPGFCDFRIFRRNGRGINDQVRTVDMFGSMSLIDRDSLIKKTFCHIGFFHVRTGYGISL